MTSIDGGEINTALDATRADDARFDRLTLPRDRFYVVTVGTFIDRKGRWTLLDAARRLCARFPDIAFLWLGPTPIGPADLARVETFGLGDGFRYLTARDFGPTRRDYLTLLREADMFALPSLQEGLPLALLEAMALAVPVVASRVNAVPEAVDHEVHGLLIKPDDVDSLVEAIARLKGDRTLRDTVAANARRRVLEEFELQDTAHSTLAAYASAWRD